VKWIADDEMLVLYFEVDDLQLDRIRTDKKWVEDKEFVAECERSRGVHAHVFKLIGDNSRGKIIQYLKHGIKDYDTVSWWNKKMTRMYIRRQSCLN